MLAAWGISITAGYVALGVYAASPSARGQSLSYWQAECVIPTDGRHPTLLIFLHPLCPCSSASIDELKEIARHCRDRVRLHALVLHSNSLKKAGAGAIERSLAEVSGMTIWRDEGGALARRFGVLSSGHVLLYDAQGRLSYSGGITPSRGHRGENFGKSAILAAILGESRDRSSSSVFGCPLFGFQTKVSKEVRQ
jgi:hypothetical protein